ncbi:MAG: hypothetical protein PVH79_03820 [Candidatus Bathyarchaeota archaeon]|jgi:hypothetical protein
MGDLDQEKAERMIKVGLHFCSRYNNIVRYDPELCGSCPYNGLKTKSN